jgi:hypothetical protein
LNGAPSICCRCGKNQGSPRCGFPVISAVACQLVADSARKGNPPTFGLIAATCSNAGSETWSSLRSWTRDNSTVFVFRSSAWRASAQNNSPVVERLPYVPAEAESGWEIHASGSTNHCGIRGLQSSVPGRDWLQRRGECSLFAHGAAKVPGDRDCAVFRSAGPNRLIKLYTFSHHRKGARLALTSSLYVYAFSPPTCESQYVVGSVKNSPCLQRLRIASSLTLMPRPGPVETGM